MSVDIDFMSRDRGIALPYSQPYVLDKFLAEESFYIVFGFESGSPIHCFELPELIQSELQAFSYSEITRFKVGEKVCLVIQLAAESDTVVDDVNQLLTNREHQIIKLVAKGLSNKQIAKHLSISEWTVSTHLRRMFMKLKVDNRAAMVYRCFPILKDAQCMRQSC